MVDLDLNTIPTVPFKAVLAVHFILITWGIQGSWSPDSYLFYNLIFILSMLWSIHEKDRVEPLQVAMAIDIFSIIADIIIITNYFPLHFFGEKLSVSFAIINLIFRPISIAMIGKLCAERMGINSTSFVGVGNIFQPQSQQRGYEDIESATPHQSIPRTDNSDLLSHSYQ
uniref:Type-1 angiotensin II receptor-associated protein n=1 Tax=Clastoptera arizonana TaxID=38151 RepID=A0A1B6DAE5_9HEMI